jgi:hypothetical protein
LPYESTAEHVTCVVPTGKSVPDWGVHETERLTPNASVANGGLYETSVPEEVLAVTLRVGIEVMVGVLVGDVTSTENDAVVVFPVESVAEQTTVVVPIGNSEPEEGLHTTGREFPCQSVA